MSPRRLGDFALTSVVETERALFAFKREHGLPRLAMSFAEG